MIIRNLYYDKLAQASYLIGCGATGDAMVIDPTRDEDLYMKLAASLGLKITAVTETHIHADYLSGSRELAAATGAKIYLSDEGGPDWSYGYANDSNVVLVRDKDRISIGNISFEVWHTPGHTPEHISFLLTDHPVSSAPHSLFAGDCIFVGDVGRPDLLERAANIAATMELGARTLFRTLSKFKDLPDSLLVWPGHGSGSACGKSLGGSPVTTLGYERQSNWAFKVSSEDKFVDEILSGQPEPPLYFKEMKFRNRQGPEILSGFPGIRPSKELVGQVIDIRSASQIRNGFYVGSTAVPYGKAFVSWCGWVVKYDSPVTLIADSQVSADVAAHDMALIGLDNVVGWVTPSDLDQSFLEPFQTISATSMEPTAQVLDVRGTGEWNMSHVKGAIHIPYGYLRDRLASLAKDKKTIVHCASGGRSPIAYSILRNAGFNDLWELSGGMAEIEIEAPEVLQAT